MTTDVGSGFDQLLYRAREGNQEALGELLHRHRSWLQLFAARQLDRRIRRRVGDSDLVQQTLLSAVRTFPEFRGTSVAELQAWLKQIFDRNLADAVRFHAALRRSLDAEATQLESPEGIAPADLPSPSQQLLFGEEAARIADALQLLPEDQRTAIRLRYLEGYSLEQLEQHFQRSRAACAGLVKRGLQALREKLEPD